jgi:KUP system potassium uptake protein
MIMTTLLLSFYLFQKKANRYYAVLVFIVFLTIEGGFLVANLHKFRYGGWFTLFLALIYFLIMLGSYFGRKIKNRYITFANLADYLPVIKDLSKDKSIPKTATNLVYIIKANDKHQVESKVIYSIFQKQPKRAETYWLLHVDRVDDPKRFEYEVEQIIPGILIRLDFHIGFKVEPKINLYFKEALEDLVQSGEISLGSSYESLKKYNFPGDFKFILIDRIMIRDYKLSNWENFVLTLNNISRKLSVTDINTLQLDATSTIVEQVPILIDQPYHRRIRRTGIV